MIWQHIISANNYFAKCKFLNKYSTKEMQWHCGGAEAEEGSTTDSQWIFGSSMLETRVAMVVGSHGHLRHGNFLFCPGISLVVASFRASGI